MLDSSNPRSLLFQLERLQQYLGELPNADTQGGELEDEERALLEAISSLKLSRISQLLESNTEQRDELKNLLDHLERLLKDFNRFISEKHFEHRADPQQLLTSTWGGH